MKMYWGDRIPPIYNPGGESSIKGMSNSDRRAKGEPQDRGSDDFDATYQPTCPLCKQKFEHPQDIKITCESCEPRRNDLTEEKSKFKPIN